jgi:hypothetical protein
MSEPFYKISMRCSSQSAGVLLHCLARHSKSHCTRSYESHIYDEHLSCGHFTRIKDVVRLCGATADLSNHKRLNGQVSLNEINWLPG